MNDVDYMRVNGFIGAGIHHYTGFWHFYDLIKCLSIIFFFIGKMGMDKIECVKRKTHSTCFCLECGWLRAGFVLCSISENLAIKYRSSPYKITIDIFFVLWNSYFACLSYLRSCKAVFQAKVVLDWRLTRQNDDD